MKFSAHSLGFSHLPTLKLASVQVVQMSVSPKTVLLKTTPTQTIVLHLVTISLQSSIIVTLTGSLKTVEEWQLKLLFGDRESIKVF